MFRIHPQSAWHNQHFARVAITATWAARSQNCQNPFCRFHTASTPSLGAPKQRFSSPSHPAPRTSMKGRKLLFRPQTSSNDLWGNAHPRRRSPIWICSRSGDGTGGRYRCNAPSGRCRARFDGQTPNNLRNLQKLRDWYRCRCVQLRCGDTVWNFLWCVSRCFWKRCCFLELQAAFCRNRRTQCERMDFSP